MSPPTAEARRTGPWSRAPRAVFGLVVAQLVLVGALVGACAGPGPVPPLISGPDDDADALVAVTAELVRAHSVAPVEVIRALQERFGARAVGDDDGVIVQAAVSAPPLGFVVDLRDVPACRDPRGGVVIGEPPRVSGCGARAMAGLAVFVVAVERDPRLRLEVLVGRAPTSGPARVWAGSGGVGVHRAGDVDVFDLDLVDAGAVTIDLRRPGGAADLDGLVVAAGRVLAWRGPAHRSRLVEARGRRRSLLDVRFGTAADADDDDLTHERCRLVAPPTPTAVRAWCHVLPGRAAGDVVAGVVLAIDDPRVIVEVAAARSPSSTGPEELIVGALRTRLAAEGLALRPGLRIEEGGSPCDALRRQGTPCVGGLPLALHPASRPAVGTPDESVEVRELQRLAARVNDVVSSISGDRPGTTDRVP